jgi:hypothetical protein
MTPLQASEKSNLRRHIMVTGCAGYLGRSICREIVAKGESIIGLYHQKLPEALDKMMPLFADLRNPDALLAPLRSVDTVVHLAWAGGVLGSDALRGTTPTRERLLSSANVLLTTNLVRAMERQGVKRIVFVSWLGADDRSDMLVLREKYWAENVILNSRIPEKIILRSGVAVDFDDKACDFAQATFRLTKIPLVTPLPRIFNDVVITSKKDLIDRVVLKATKPCTDSNWMFIDEITSTAPITSSSAVISLTAKWWGQNKWAMGGFLGRYLFKLLDSEFGRLKDGKPRISDFLQISRSSHLLQSASFMKSDKN